MNMGRVVPGAVMGLGGIVATAGVVTMTMGDAPIAVDAGYTTLRVCVDNASEQNLYLSGDEQVGSLDKDDFGLDYALDLKLVEIADLDENEYRYFFGNNSRSSTRRHAQLYGERRRGKHPGPGRLKGLSDPRHGHRQGQRRHDRGRSRPRGPGRRDLGGQVGGVVRR